MVLEIIHQPEGRRLEFKEKIPTVSELAKTVISFANDAGGEVYFGIKDKPREIIGLPEDDLVFIEEQINNIIFDNCFPIIIPEISFLNIDGKHVLKLKIYIGSNPPYYIKKKNKLEGTYVRVGSSNRLASEEIIAELERRKRNISYDAEIFYEKTFEELNIHSFQTLFKEKTGEDLNENVLKKLNLFKEIKDRKHPTNALILLSDDSLRNELFPYAKIECARFKGTTSELFIDQKTIEGNVSLQIEQAYNFVLRHINNGGEVKGVYTERRWEYPVTAIREVIRNAIVHRDYSLHGKDIKIAIYDDMVEVTSPGRLLPSIDFNELEAGQSEIRNKILALVFKKLGIIDQWGNGLKLIYSELKKYPEIEFKWSEIGLQFQIKFVKKSWQSL